MKGTSQKWNRRSQSRKQRELFGMYPDMILKNCGKQMGIFMHESRFPGHRSITRYCRVTPIITIWRKTWITQKDIPDAFTPIRATAENLQTC